MPNRYILRRQNDNGLASLMDTDDIKKCVEGVKVLHPTAKYKWDRKENTFSTDVEGFKYTIEKIYEDR